MNEVSRCSILVVDDSPEQIRFVSELLRPEGYRVFAATNCREAMQLLNKKNFQLILLDIVMPDMDGFTFCEFLKRDDKFRDIPVIFATAYHDVENLNRCFQVGGCDYVVKPYIKEELLERVKVRIRYADIRIELQKANEELDHFCYTLSHDVRAPLYVIKQLSDLLKDEVDAGNYLEISEICGMISEKASRTASMADGLHRFSTSLYKELYYETIDLDQLVMEIYEDLLCLENERDITLKKEALGSVYGDLQLIRVVILNVLGNAIKFTRNCKSAEISVLVKKFADETILTFQDNGVGFDSAKQEEIFRVFHCGNENEFEGDGIGLATVKRIMERHKGKVKIVGILGEGTSVELTFPDK